MDDLIDLIKEKIKVCAESISSNSPNQLDLNEVQAIEHLARAMSYLNRIKECTQNNEEPSVAEKRYAILKYCSARMCDECVINRKYNPLPGRCTGTDEEVIKHYDAIKEDK